VLRRAAASKKNALARLFDATLDQARQCGLIPATSRLAAIDSTGLESRHVSHYFTRRCGRHKAHNKARYPKVSALCDTGSHVVLGAVVDRGPKPDHCEFKATVREAHGRQPFAILLGDAGYDSEPAHRWCRESLGVRSVFPLNRSGRLRRDGLPRRLGGHWRRKLARRFPRKIYGQRWQAETVFSMIKRNLDSALRARRVHSQNREALLRILTHNLMILLCATLLMAFQQSRTLPYFDASNVPDATIFWHPQA
jgi:hypothetical protein